MKNYKLKKYKYLTQNEEYRYTRGVIEALTDFEARELLSQCGNLIIELKEKKETALERGLTEKRRRLSLPQKSRLFKELSYLISAGYTLQNSLSLMRSCDKKSNWQNALENIEKDLDNTNSFSGALLQSGSFAKDIVYQVHSAEISGGLPETLSVLSDKFEKSSGIHNKLKLALIMPSILFMFLFALIYFFSAVVAPQMLELFKALEIEEEIPALTRVVIGITSFIAEQGIRIAGFTAAAAAVLSFAFAKSDRLRFARDTTLIKSKITGDTLRMLDMIKYNSVFGALYLRGLPPAIIFESATETLKNAFIKSRAKEAMRQVIEDGIPITAAFKNNALYSEEELQFIEVGAATDSLSEIMEILVKRGTELLDYKASSAIEFIKLASVFVFGVVLIILLFAFYLPIYSATSNFSI